MLFNREVNGQHYRLMECDVRWTGKRVALRIHISRQDGAVMGFREVHDVFTDAYPEAYALQVFPPQDRLIDQANKYHLFVMTEVDAGLDLTEPCSTSIHPRSVEFSLIHKEEECN